MVLLAAAVGGWWCFTGQHCCSTAHGNAGGELDGFRNESIEMMDNPMRAAATAAAAAAAAASTPDYVANLYEPTPTRNMHARAAAQLPPPVLSPSPGAATTVVYSTAVETGDFIYVADGNGDPSTANGSSSSSIAQSSTQPPVVVYSVPHANRNHNNNHGEASYSGYEPPVMEQNASAGGTSSSTIIYAVPAEEPEDGVRSAVARTPNPMYQPADGPSTDNRTVARTPNPMYQPASNNMYDAGVVSSNSDSNSNA